MLNLLFQTNVGGFEVDGELLMCIDDAPINVVSIWAWRGTKNANTSNEEKQVTNHKAKMLLKCPVSYV